jgi:hypothetical protein
MYAINGIEVSRRPEHLTSSRNDQAALNRIWQQDVYMDMNDLPVTRDRSLALLAAIAMPGS